MNEAKKVSTYPRAVGRGVSMHKEEEGKERATKGVYDMRLPERRTKTKREGPSTEWETRGDRSLGG